MNHSGILKNKLFLYLTEFFAGMSVMAVELGASRLLAPYFSSSQIVWTIVIGTIMIAMALGNIYGGKSADKSPNPDKLYGRILIAAIWIALIPVVGKYIILGISALLIFTVSNNFLIIAAFAACMVIFVFPLFLLGTVTPSLVKYSVDSLDDSGQHRGNFRCIQYRGKHHRNLRTDFRDDPGGGNLHYISDLFRNSDPAVCDLLYLPAYGKEKDCSIGTDLYFMLWSGIFGFLCFLAEGSDLRRRVHL